MKLAYINPNATESMTVGIVETARRAMPGTDIFGLTNTDGPPAIEGAADGEAAIPGVLSRRNAARAAGVDALVIACFDDTGLEDARAHSDFPILGIGQYRSPWPR